MIKRTRIKVRDFYKTHKEAEFITFYIVAHILMLICIYGLWNNGGQRVAMLSLGFILVPNTAFLIFKLESIIRNWLMKK